MYSPPESKEIRVRSDLISHDSIKASFSAKIFAEDLENVITGHKLHVINNMSSEEVDKLKKLFTIV